jgi:UDP-sugar transporter A1/2/3
MWGEALKVLSPSPKVFGYVCMLLVSLQVGLQPIVTRCCVTDAVSTKSLVLAENGITVVMSLLLTAPGAFVGWSMSDSLSIAGPPAIVYAIRSLCKQGAYRRCDGVTFNIINQTKTVFCAMAAWLLLGEAQTPQQCTALLCAVAAGALLIVPQRADSGSPTTKDISKDDTPMSLTAQSTLSSGLALAVATAVCSGVAAALSQMAFRKAGSRPSTLFTFELALWGAPFAILLGGSGSSNGSASKVLRGWRLRTFVPVALQAGGGILVGAVVKQHGGVAMGLCTIIGIGVSAIADSCYERRPPTVRQLLASTLAASSIIAHQIDS